MVEKRPDELVLDELTDQLDRTRRLLRESPEDVARRALDSLGGPEADADARITALMARTNALAHPGQFSVAHRLVIHSLEVLDAEGSRSPKIPRLWFLTPVVEFLVEFVAEYIVRSYTSAVVARLRMLYVRREAQAAPGSPERRLLQQARVEIDRLVPSFSGGGRSGLLLLAGGVSLPALLSSLRFLGVLASSGTALVISVVAALPVVAAFAWILLRGAAVARRRSQLIMARPLGALWETIGDCGRPPEDHSTQIASIAIVLTAVIWLALPVVAFAGYATFR